MLALRSHCCFLFFLNIQAYHDPMLKLSIMTEEELAHIFGDLDAYIPLHEGKIPFWIQTVLIDVSTC